MYFLIFPELKILQFFANETSQLRLSGDYPAVVSGANVGKLGEPGPSVLHCKATHTDVRTLGNSPS